MPRTAAGQNEDFARLRQLRDPSVSVQDRLRALMGPAGEQAPVDVDTEFDFAPEPPLDVQTQKAQPLSPINKFWNRVLRNAPYALSPKPVPANPEGASRRSNGTSSSSFRMPSGGLLRATLRLGTLGVFAAYARAHAARGFVQV